MHWPRDLDGWPHREASRRTAGPVHRWHLQEMGTGPRTLLLVHGAGGSTHSWRLILPALARRYRVIAPDLPGHAFTQLGTRNRSGLGAMAADLIRLAQSEGWRPDALVGHSAGAAIALETTRAGQPWEGTPVIGINAALGPFPGLAGVIFPVIAQVMSAAPFVPRLVARQIGQEAQIARLIDSTGSALDPEGRALYRRLAADPDHIGGTLRMMAQWDLAPLRAAFASHSSPVLLLAGDRDKTVPPAISDEAAAAMPHARAAPLPGLGHLAQEEAPGLVIEAILSELDARFA